MIYSFVSFGYEGVLIEVSTDVRKGTPSVDIVGLADSRVKASKENICTAMRSQGFHFPKAKVLLSLSPCDIRKEGSAFDFPLALALCMKESITGDTYNEEDLKEILNTDVFVMGELNLDGSVRGIPAVNAGLQTAKDKGIKYAIVPRMSDLVIPEGMKVAMADSLDTAVNCMWKLGESKYFSEGKKKENVPYNVEFMEVSDEESLDKIEGKWGLKYAMTVAVAGRHNIMAVGSPGCSKTLVLQKIWQILPLLTEEEKKSVDRIYSIAGPDGSLIGRTGERPVRIPHQTAGIEGICGGGPDCRPGEISLAHNGVLFLDEAAEFRSSVLQMLRVPLESKMITLSRAGRSTVFPADFQLVMALNPCPCGNYGNRERICLCSAQSIRLYWKKISEPLLDRIAIKFNCNEDDSMYHRYTLSEMKEHIKLAWERQYTRQGKLNDRLTSQEIEKYIVLTDRARNVLEEECTKKSLSVKVKENIMKVAQTLVDMEFSPSDKVTELEIRMAIDLCRYTPEGDL